MGNSFSYVDLLRAVKPASAYQISEYRHEVETSNSSEISSGGRCFAQLCDSASRNVGTTYDDWDRVACMFSGINRCRVIGGWRDALSSHVSLLPHLTGKAGPFFHY